VRFVTSIAEWLASLGLSDYAQRFIDNDIDVDVLPELTEGDLEQLGVSLGHRRKSSVQSEAASNSLHRLTRLPDSTGTRKLNVGS
jgi:hypothetical protein